MFDVYKSVLSFVVDLLYKIERGNWKIYPFLQEFHQLKSSFNRINWCCISHETNRAANTAAKLANMGLCSVDWNGGPPIPMMEVLSADGLSGPP